MSVLDRKLLRDLKDTRGLLLAITSIITVGVACYVAMASCHRNLSTGQRLYYAQCRMADFTIRLKKAPLVDIDQVAKIPGVVKIRPRIESYATVDLEQVVEPLNGMVLSLPDRREEVINDIVLRQGSYFTDTRDNEVIINEAFARQHGLYPGQWVHLLLNNRRQELFVVGTAISSEFTYMLGPGAITPDPEHFGVFYIKRTFAEDVFDFQGAANEVVGQLAPNVRQRPAEILRQAEELLDPFGVFTSVPLADQASNRFLNSEIEGLRAFGFVMPGMFLAVAALVLNTLMSRLAEQQRVVVGTLKALGYSDGQIFAQFIKFGMVVGLIGGLVGCAFGFWLADGMTDMYRKFYEFPSLSNRFHLNIHATGLLISLACALVGSLHGARAVLKLEAAEAMRPKPPAQGGAIWLEHVAWFWRTLSFGWRTTLRNLFRHRLRTAAGVFAGCMGAAVSVNALGMAAATTYLIDFQFQQVLRSDLDLTFKDERGRDGLDEVRHLPGVDRAEPLLDVGGTFYNGSHSYKGGITGLAPGARLTIPRDSASRPLRIPSVGLVMTRRLAEMLHVSPGDQIVFRPSKGQRRPCKIPVAAINDSFIGLSVYADIDYLSRLVNEEFAVNGAQLTTAGNHDTRRQLYRQLKQLPALQAVTARTDMIDNLMNTVIENLWVFISMLLLFAGIIFFGSVLNASLIGLSERQREVATLRVLGYTPWQVGGLFLRESMLTTLVGTILGMPVGYLLSVVTAKAYDTDWFRFPVVTPSFIWFTTLALGVLFALLAHGFVQREVFRMDWLDALKTKE